MSTTKPTPCRWCHRSLHRSYYRDSGRQKSCTSCSVREGEHVFYKVDWSFGTVERTRGGERVWQTRPRCEWCRGVEDDQDEASSCSEVFLYSDITDAVDDLRTVTLGGRRVPWFGPLGTTSKGLQWLELMGEGAWGYLEDCGWQALLDEAPEAIGRHGQITRSYMRHLVEVAELLADEGESAGPESSPTRWLGWLVWSLAEPNAAARKLMD